MAGAINDQHQNSAVALNRVRNFEVGCVHAKFGCEREYFGCCSGAVRNWYANFNNIEQIANSTWQVGTRNSRRLQSLRELVRSAFVNNCPHGLQTANHSIECADDCFTI
ncbi:MAG: hypothetical protein JZU63_06470, partial [Rhodoferax sp.]|nr:hypothetical protein [Rhodoferax sp.]